jgi:hypothetical protein
MDASYVVIQKIVTLFQSEVNTDAPDAFRIIFASLKSAQKLGWEARTTGELGDASKSAYGCDWHDTSDNGDVDVGERATLAEVKEVAIIVK